MKIAAPSSNAVDSATSTITRPLYRSRERLVVPAPSLIGVAGSVAAARNAGTTPVNARVTRARRSANPKTASPGVAARSPSSGTDGESIVPRIASDQYVSTSPAAVPQPATTAHSASTSRMIACRVAPSAMRTAISRCFASPRASIIVPRFAQVMISTVMALRMIR